MNTPPVTDRAFSLTTSAPQKRPDDRSYTLSSAADRNYPTSRLPLNQQQQRRIDDGRSMTISGRMGGNGGSSPQLDFSRPSNSRQQIPPGSPRRVPPTSGPSRSGTGSLSGVREEGPETTSAAPAHTSLPSISTTMIASARHESVDSISSDVDSTVSGPQRTKSASSFPAVSPSSANTDRRPSLPKAPSSQVSLARSRAPIVYPALLSRVAIALRERLTLGDKQKDGLTYPNAFTGSEAVDVIAFIIKTSDRNLALLLGRALDAQRWFHDVTYVHRYSPRILRN
jgi:RHO1 GDP-GTP exchange protein 1/2